MGGKKGSGGKGKKGGGDAGEDDSTQRLLNLYSKKCVELGTTIPAKVRERFNDCLNEGEVLTELNIWEPIGWQGAKALGDALLEIKYDKLTTLRFWKCGIEDNGLRYICNYLMINKSVTVVEFMDNNITWLGCEFLGRVLRQEVGSPITTLKLDHNPIGSKGVAMLTEGLSMNPTLKILTLNYCEIDQEGAKSLFQILIYIKSAIKEVQLRGNNLKNEGLKELMDVMLVSKALEKIDLADNKVVISSAEDELTNKIYLSVSNKTTIIGSYDFSYNHINPEAVKKIVDGIKEGELVSDFKLTTEMDDDFRTDFQKTLVKNKKNAKKRAKKKKGKKKGKKKK